MRVDIGAGVAIAIVVLITGPGLAVVGLCALALVVICAASYLVGRRLRRVRTRRARTRQRNLPGRGGFNH